MVVRGPDHQTEIGMRVNEYECILVLCTGLGHVLAFGKREAVYKRCEKKKKGGGGRIKTGRWEKL